MSQLPPRTDAEKARKRAVLMRHIATVVRRRRTELGLTQEDVAELLGLNTEFYARIERGHGMPSVETFARIVSVLGVSADSLLGRTDKRQATPVRQKPRRDPPEISRLVERARGLSRAEVRLISLLLKELGRKPTAAPREPVTVPPGDESA